MKPNLKNKITHVWSNGTIVTAELDKDQDVNLIIEGPGENNLCDVVMGEQEAIAVAHALLTVVMRRLEDSSA